MDDKRRERLLRLMEIFETAVGDERKAQELYRRGKNDCDDDPERAALFDWLYKEEVRHEQALLEHYAILKKSLSAQA